ncbi:hypothetical protein BJV82DRAFT_624098, partial [Fennellomyces sp. T-0311]
MHDVTIVVHCFTFLEYSYEASLSVALLSYKIHTMEPLSKNMLSYSGGIVGLIILILDLIVIFEVLNSNRSAGGKIGWSLLVFFFPVVGIILYFLFSNRAQHSARYEPI